MYIYYATGFFYLLRLGANKLPYLIMVNYILDRAYNYDIINL